MAGAADQRQKTDRNDILGDQDGDGEGPHPLVMQGGGGDQLDHQNGAAEDHGQPDDDPGLQAVAEKQGQ